MITLSKTHLSELHQHGIEAYPEECCGAMLGRMLTDSKQVVELVRIENQSTENKHRRFAVTAEDYKAIEDLAKEKKLSLLGFYHTHPDHPAQPSETDLKFAWPFFSYFILSVKKGRPDILNSFVLDLDKNELVEEKVQVSESV